MYPMMCTLTHHCLCEFVYLCSSKYLVHFWVLHYEDLMWPQYSSWDVNRELVVMSHLLP